MAITFEKQPFKRLYDVKGQSCRYAILATAIFQKFHRSKKAAPPIIEKGTKTIIETMKPKKSG